jgi:uncharacterized protein with FMN-binding domain
VLARFQQFLRYYVKNETHIKGTFMNQANNTPKVIGAFVISAVLLIGAYFVLAQNSEDAGSATDVVVTTPSDNTANTPQPEATTTEQTTAEPSPTETTEQVVTSTYTDGTYSASGTYRVPGGDIEDISIDVTLDGDIISAIVVDTVATNEDSVEYQSGFDAAINGTVEGQDLDDADVFRLGGASLTSNAFNDLLEGIRNSARI